MVYERKFSKLYQVDVPALAVDEVFFVDLEKMPYGKYLPFNFVMVTNNSEQRIRLIINDSVRIIILPGTSWTFDSATLPAVWSLKLQNKGTASTNDNEVYLSFQKIPEVKARAFKVLGGDM